MINVHFNGEVVRCPDISAIRKRTIERYDKECRCNYGLSEPDCETWSLFQSQYISHLNKRCHLYKLFVLRYDEQGKLFKQYHCPRSQAQYLHGCKEKSYSITPQTFRKIASQSHYLVKESNYKTIFFTLTFPEFKTNVNGKQINKYFSKFMENLRTNYGCKGYIAVRENGKLYGRFHYHILCSIPFVPFITLNSVWCNTISDICYFSPAALRTDAKTVFIKNPVRAIKYVCKYFAKCKGTKSDSRIVFVSNDFINEHTGEVINFPLKPKKIYNTDVMDLLKDKKGIYMHSNDYTTTFRITDNKSLTDFFSFVIYKLYGCSPGKMPELSGSALNSG